jgi:hypothetical protein
LGQRFALSVNTKKMAKPRAKRVAPRRMYSSEYGPELRTESIKTWAPNQQKRIDNAVKMNLSGFMYATEGSLNLPANSHLEGQFLCLGTSL